MYVLHRKINVWENPPNGGEKTMKSLASIRTRLSILEYMVKNEETIQHTHKIPENRGEIKALKWVLEPDVEE